MHIQNIWKKADSLRGCLSSLRTGASRRRYAEDEDPLAIANPFVSDEAKLLSSKAFRVMRDKTQVFSYVETPLVRSRQTHVLEVVAVSVIASEMLGLNTDLVRAAAIGHDIGHVPFGHQGEAWLAETMDRPFCHEIMGVVTAQHIERSGRGLNLAWDTQDAMMRHSGDTAREGMSQEAWVLRHTDKFAYIFADVNDIFLRMGYPVPGEIGEILRAFGETQRERTTTAIAGLVVESAECGRVSFEHSELGQKFSRLRKLMYGVYPCVTQQNVARTLGDVLEFLEQIKVGDPFLLLALMTDRDVQLIANATMRDMQVWKRTAVSEIASHLWKIGPVDLCNPDLAW